MIGLKEDNDLKNFSLIKNLNFPKVQLSLRASLCIVAYILFFSNKLTFLFTFCLLA